jgi:hypothetical protein
VDSLTAVGGGATGFIGGGAQDFQKDIAKKADEIARMLPRIEKSLEGQNRRGDAILGKMTELQ